MLPAEHVIEIDVPSARMLVETKCDTKARPWRAAGEPLSIPTRAEVTSTPITCYVWNIISRLLFEHEERVKFASIVEVTSLRRDNTHTLTPSSTLRQFCINCLLRAQTCLNGNREGNLFGYWKGLHFGREIQPLVTPPPSLPTNLCGVVCYCRIKVCMLWENVIDFC